MFYKTLSLTANSTFDFELWNFVIACFALVIASYAIWVTKSQNRFRIEIDDFTYSIHRGDPGLFCFSLHNISAVPAKILKIEFFTEDSKPLNPILGHEPAVRYRDVGFNMVIPEMLTLFEHESVLTDPQVLLSNSSFDFRYFIKSASPKLIVKVTCDHRINFGKKSKSFFVEFRKSK